MRSGCVSLFIYREMIIVSHFGIELGLNMYLFWMQCHLVIEV